MAIAERAVSPLREPTFNEAASAALLVITYYGAIRVGRQVSRTQLAGQEAVERVNALTQEVLDGIVTSHNAIAGVVQQLGNGTDAELTHELDVAAFHLGNAVLERQAGFTDASTR